MSLVNNALKLGTTKSASTLMLVLSFPIIANLYPPENVGLQSLYISLIMLLIPVACLRLELALVVERHESRVSEIFVACIISSIVFSVVTYFLCCLIFSMWPNLSAGTNTSLMIWLISLNFMVEGMLQALNGLATRVGNVIPIAISDLLKSATMVAYPIAVAFFGNADSYTLIHGYMLGSTFGLIVLMPVGIRFLKNTKTKISKSILDTVRSHTAFTTYGSLGAIVNGFATQLPIIIMASIFGREVLGYISAAINVLKIPLRIGSSAVSRALFIELGQEPKGSTRIINESRRSVLLVSLILTPFITLIPITDIVFSTAFGPEWAPTSDYYLPLLSLYVIWSLTSPLSILFNILGQQRELLILQLVKLISRVSSLIGGYYFLGPKYTIFVYATISTGAQLLQLSRSFNLSGESYLGAISFVAKQFSLPVAVCLAVYAIGFLATSLWTLIAWGSLTALCILYQVRTAQ